jgi:hypothetical protein
MERRGKLGGENGRYIGVVGTEKMWRTRTNVGRGVDIPREIMCLGTAFYCSQSIFAFLSPESFTESHTLGLCNGFDKLSTLALSYIFAPTQEAGIIPHKG